MSVFSDRTWKLRGRSWWLRWRQTNARWRSWRTTCSPTWRRRPARWLKMRLWLKHWPSPRRPRTRSPRSCRSLLKLKFASTLLVKSSDQVKHLSAQLYRATATSSILSLYSVSQKNIPDIFSCNSRKHCRIFIMFGTHVTEKVSNQ